MSITIFLCELLGGILAGGVILRALFRAFEFGQAVLEQLAAIVGQLVAIRRELAVLRRDLAAHESAPTPVAHPRRLTVREHS